MAWDNGRTLKWLLLSIAITVGGTLLLWQLFGEVGLFAFLFLPFLPIFFRGAKHVESAGTEMGRPRTCPHCGMQSIDPEDRYCPRDGSTLV